MHSKAQEIVRVGTSGIVVPGTKVTFPEEFKSGSRLHYYGSLFNTLEINSSFYKIPLAKTFKKWSEEVPENFTFTVKCWRGITHAKHLEITDADIDVFMATIATVGSKAGCLLIQFPPSINVSYLKKVEKILERITYNDTNQQWRLAIELRHMSWYCDAAYAVFEKYKAAVVLHDMPGSTTPLQVPITNLLYLRFHGPTGNYDGCYSPDFIKSRAEQVQQWKNTVSNIYIYFNNTIGGAYENAQMFNQFLKL